jgi:hypothetical protein
MKRRGLAEPLLTVIDGNSGLRKAVGRKLPLKEEIMLLYLMALS